MEVEFKTLQELKQKLPEVLHEIKTLRLLADAERVMLDAQIQSACRCLVGYTEWSWFESDEAIKETFANKMLHEMRAEWLQSQVDKLKTHPEL